MPRRKACDHAPEGSASESVVSRNTRSSERRNIPEAGRPEEPGRCKLPLARSLQLRSVRRQHRNSFEMPHFRFLIRADSVRVFFFCRFSNSRRFGFEFCNYKNCSHIRSERRTVTDTEDMYGWNDRTVAGILDNEIYLGHTVNCRTTVVSYKDKRVIDRPESEQYRFENTHEAIVDKTTWDIVRQVRQGKRRRNSMGEVNKYSGLLYCADCGSKLYFVRGRTMKPDAFNFICSRYRKHMGEKQCTPHSIREITLDEIILEEIRRVISEARKHTAEFVRFISQKSSSENRKELNTKLSEQSKLIKRNEELNLLFKRLYEDNVLGKVTNEQFRMLSDGYNAEQKTTVERLEQLKAEIEQLKSTAINVERFVVLARKYTDIRELTPEILRTFISKIVIHERPSRKKNDGEQQIDIYFTHIGSMPDSESERADHCRDKAISARTAEFSDAHQKPISTIRL